jgi:hypothetical protein
MLVGGWQGGLGEVPEVGTLQRCLSFPEVKDVYDHV